MQTGPDELRETYRRRFEGEEEYRLGVWRVLVARCFQRYAAPDATVLDLGCGYGQFINTIQCGLKYAMDLNPGSREQLAVGVRFFEQDCSKEWPLGDESLDLVFTSNFLEHLPSKEGLTKTVAQAVRCLRKGGRFVAMGPNIKYVGGAYWDFYDHNLPLTELSLKEALEVSGLRAQRVVDRFLPYTMVNAPRYPASMIDLYLRMPVFWRWFGKQFLIVAVK